VKKPGDNREYHVIDDPDEKPTPAEHGVVVVPHRPVSAKSRLVGGQSAAAAAAAGASSSSTTASGGGQKRKQTDEHGWEHAGDDNEYERSDSSQSSESDSGSDTTSDSGADENGVESTNSVQPEEDWEHTYPHAMKPMLFTPNGSQYEITVHGRTASSVEAKTKDILLAILAQISLIADGETVLERTVGPYQDKHIALRMSLSWVLQKSNRFAKAVATLNRGEYGARIGRRKGRKGSRRGSFERDTLKAWTQVIREAKTGSAHLVEVDG